ncbi:DUF5906 domain-containing protein [Leuconostoc citreum]|uniref:DUF5906 domain-containing protein n=1 Tax=Leuconostoc citreum TaxID=33964 RepID=UPI0032DFA16A
MSDEYALRSVTSFKKNSVLLTYNDFNDGMSLGFVNKLSWLDVTVKQKENQIKYKVTSIVNFAEWLIGYDSVAVKDDYGYIWNGSYWQSMPVKSIFNMIDVSILTIADKLQLSSNKKRELQKDVKPILIEQSRGFDNSAKPGYIAFKNWTLNINTNNFFPPKKEMNLIDGFDFAPDETGQAPDTWVAYADYMFGSNSKFLWAWLGYAFQTNMNWRQGALFLLDPIGGTGKTHFVTKITQAMFGEKRVGAFKLKNLQGNNARFETARFVGKSIMVDDDATRVRFKEDDTFKSITGGGLSPVERKGVDGTEYRITSKMIINVNEMPIFNNAGAIKRRLHIIKTQAPVATAKEIEIRNTLFSEDDLENEVPRLATYAIEMYQQAVIEDWHVEKSIVDDIVAQDPFITWHETLRPGLQKATELYQDYTDFYDTKFASKNEDDKPMSVQAWGRKMANWNEKITTREGKFYKI